MDSNKQALLQKLEELVKSRSASTDFIHHEWFVRYHIEIVEKIARELVEYYPQADLFKIITLVWLHDFEKIVDFGNQYNTELDATVKLMQKVGFEESFIEQMRLDINTFNSKTNLERASIETQIVSSADAASHYTGPFGSLYWYENPTVPISEVQTERLRKIEIDWSSKVTLPEIKKAFQARYDYAKEVTGELPEKYLQ